MNRRIRFGAFASIANSLASGQTDVGGGISVTLVIKIQSTRGKKRSNGTRRTRKIKGSPNEREKPRVRSCIDAFWENVGGHCFTPLGCNLRRETLSASGWRHDWVRRENNSKCFPLTWRRRGETFPGFATPYAASETVRGASSIGSLIETGNRSHKSIAAPANAPP